MERQTILERLGWQFIRIRGSEFYRDSEAAMHRVIKELSEYGIEPEKNTPIQEKVNRDSELLERVKQKAHALLCEYDKDSIDMESVAAALDSKNDIISSKYITAKHKKDEEKIGEVKSEPNKQKKKEEIIISKTPSAVKKTPVFSSSVTIGARSTSTIKEEPKVDMSNIKVGTQVSHRIFGIGTITNFKGNLITVKFTKSEQKFKVPHVFEGGFLKEVK